MEGKSKSMNANGMTVCSTCKIEKQILMRWFPFLNPSCRSRFLVFKPCYFNAYLKSSIKIGALKSNNQSFEDKPEKYQTSWNFKGGLNDILICNLIKKSNLKMNLVIKKLSSIEEELTNWTSMFFGIWKNSKCRNQIFQLAFVKWIQILKDEPIIGKNIEIFLNLMAFI